MVLAGTIRALALDHIIDAVDNKAVRDTDPGDGDMVDTESKLAGLTVEMSMAVIVMTDATTVTKFVHHLAISTVNSMYKMMFSEHGKGAIDARLVNGGYAFFQFGHGYRTIHARQHINDDYPVGRGSHTMILKHLHQFIRIFHFSFCYGSNTS